ncbi:MULTISPECIES: hypothetical protein [Burkholderia]|uniref:Uncharacterized protein n=1 Tax=Burkholderia contaminans TaxID=488447 RepID=A0AAP4QZL2_9BURK|nr:hypothetical protein [Burkholderia contaminans]MDK0993482.1 hypothetical protein [Burkholderia contaminans]MDN7564732.1 hypothetical protein [Burkholderia contaminans]
MTGTKAGTEAGVVRMRRGTRRIDPPIIRTPRATPSADPSFA